MLKDKRHCFSKASVAVLSSAFYSSFSLSLSTGMQLSSLMSNMLIILVPPGVPKDMLTRNDHTPKPESPVRQGHTTLDSNQGVPVNLTCKLTRKQQTVKFESVSVGFSNNSHVLYRQCSTDIENDNGSDKIDVY